MPTGFIKFPLSFPSHSLSNLFTHSSPFSAHIPSLGISASLADFLSKCFQRDPALRVSAKELTSHPWLRKQEAEVETTVENAAKKIAGHQQKLHMVKTEVGLERERRRGEGKGRSGQR